MTTIFLVVGSSSPFARPGDWADAANTICGIGAGGAGGTGGLNTSNLYAGSGGAGGGYAARVNQTLTATTVFSIGVGGPPGGAAANGGTGGNTTISTPSSLSAGGGGGGKGHTNTGTASVAGTNTGTTTFAGGIGPASSKNNSGTGGGGAAGPSGAGKNGGTASTSANNTGGGSGGGGANGGSSTAGAASTSNNGSAGGTGPTGTAGGAAVGANTTGNPGSNGSGGSGAGSVNVGGTFTLTGGSGSTQALWTQTSDSATAGPGGGGGAGAATPTGIGTNQSQFGGTGGAYGGGGGGGGAPRVNGAVGGNFGGAGANGIIVLEYTGAPADDYNLGPFTLATSAPALATGAVTQNHVVPASALASASPTLVRGTVSQNHVIAASALVTAAPIFVLGTISTNIAVPAGSLTTASPTLAAGTVTQKHVVAVASLASASPTLAAGAVAQNHVVVVASLASASPTLATGAVTQTHVVTLFGEIVGGGGAAILPASTLQNLDASVAASVTGTSTVTAWADLSVNGLGATGAGGRQPSYDSTVKSIKNGIMVLDHSAIGAEWNVFTVVRRLGDTSDYRTLLQTGGNDHHILTIQGTDNLTSFVGGPGITTHTWPANALHLIRCQRLAAATSHSLDGGALVSTGQVNNDPNYLGGASTGGQNFGDIHQVVFLPGDASTADIQLVEGLLAWKWDGILGGNTLVTALPAGHPHKSAAPGGAGLNLPTLVITTAAGVTTVALTAKTVGALTLPSLVVTMSAPLQYLSPSSDVSPGGWTNEVGGTSLYGSIDESVPNVADYIRSSVDPVHDSCVLELSDPASPLATPVTCSYLYGKETNNADRVDLTARLMQGATEIAAWVHADIPYTAVQADQLLTAPQYAAITNAAAVRLEFIANPVAANFVTLRDGSPVTDRAGNPITLRA